MRLQSQFLVLDSSEALQSVREILNFLRKLYREHFNKNID
jgi:hypothetical protein